MDKTFKALLVKVPAITLWFWIIKILSTTVGETFADQLDSYLQDNFGVPDTLSPLYNLYIWGALLLVVLAFQVLTKKYIAWLYWLAVVLISVEGTLITDNLHDGLGVPLLNEIIWFGSALLITFTVWFIKERTLEMKSINTKPRELFYWLAILCTFALGTATGDYFSESMAIGYGYSLLVFAGLFSLVGLLWKFKVLNAVTTFWIAYIISRPLGASLGDLLSQPVKDTGLGLGTQSTSLLFLALIAICVGYLSLTKSDVLRNESEQT